MSIFKKSLAILVNVTILVFWVSQGPASASPTQAASLYAITNVNVIPMDSERILENQTVLVENESIIAIGASDRVKAPDEAIIIDGAGKYVIPGLIDMHIHIERGRERSLVLYLANGVTTVRNMAGSPWHLDLRERIENKEVLGPRFYTTSPTTFSARMANTPEAAQKFVEEQKAAGYDSIKMYGTRPSYEMTPETYRSLIKTAKRLGMKVVGHTPRGLPFEAVLEEGQDSVDHAEEIFYVHKPILDKLGRVADFQFGRISLKEYRELRPDFPDLEMEVVPEIKRLAKEVKRSGLVFSPGLITYQTILRQITPEYTGMLNDQKMQYVYPLWRLYTSPGFNSYRGRWSGRLDEMIPVIRNTLEIQKLMVREFHKAGVPMMTGTDATNPLVIEGFSLHDEMQLLVEADLSPYEALKAATITPAKFLDVESKIGTIAVGKEADLVLLDGNPLAAIANSRKINGVFVDGKWLSKKNLDQSLEDLVLFYQPFWQAIQNSRNYFQNDDFKGALEYYKGLSTNRDDIADYFESSVNRSGYRFVRQKKLDQAETVFKLNTEYFPKSSNTWDSLAEVYLLKDDKELAVQNYKKVLELDPENKNAADQVRKIEIMRKPSLDKP